jgi:transposase
LEQASPLPIRRIATGPGQEAQVDFGQGARVVENGQRHRPHVRRVVLSHSRMGYTEVFWRQTTENFIRGTENALRHFGGVVRTLVTDNLRAAVTKVDGFELKLNSKVVSFFEHYGTVILPTKPTTPRHKARSKPDQICRNISKRRGWRANSLKVWPPIIYIWPTGRRP